MIKHNDIDGDVLTYRAGFACQKTLYTVFDTEKEAVVASLTGKAALNEWTKEHPDMEVDIDSEVVAEPLSHALSVVKHMLADISAHTGTNDYTVHLSPSTTFRHRIAPYYKQSRKDAPKPIHYSAIRDYLVDTHNAIIHTDQEADDGMGIAAMSEENHCICTIDKDLDNVPGWHFNFVKRERYFVEPEQAMFNFYTQLITGDTTDDIPGLYKIAGKKYSGKDVEPLLYMHTEQDMWNYVVDLYCSLMKNTDKDNVVAKLTETGQLLWIRQKENEIWEPPHGKR